MIKHIPERKCVACGGHFPQKTMIKVTKNSDSFFIDQTMKANGRGAYVCNTKECIETAITKRQFNRSFKTAVPDELYAELKAIAEGMVQAHE